VNERDAGRAVESLEVGDDEHRRDGDAAVARLVRVVLEEEAARDGQVVAG
jgi:hypothetical protein